MQVFTTVGTCATHLEVQNTAVGYCRASCVRSLLEFALTDCSTVSALNGNRVPFDNFLPAHSRGRRSPDTRFMHTPAFAITVGDLFEGYRRYGSPQKPFIWCHNTAKWRRDLAEAMSVDLATCFWRSLAFIASHAQVVAMWGRAALTTPAGVMDGVSRAQAVMMFQAAPMLDPAGLPEYSIYGVNPITGRCNVLLGGVKQAGLVYVCLNDDGEHKPHWLPMTNYVQANAEPATADDILLGLPEMAAAGLMPPNVMVAWNALQANFAAWNPLPPPPVVPPPPPPAPVPPPPPPPPLNVPPAHYVFQPPDCDGFVCYRDPPVEDLGVVAVPQLGVVPPPVLFQKKLWVHTPTTAVGTLRLMEGLGPDAFDRILAHGTGCGFCFELRPETILGQEICDRDYCFCEDSAPSTRSHGLNLLGQYHVRFLSVIVTDGGTWRLRRVGRSGGLNGRFIDWFKFCKSCHSNVLSFLCDHIPLHTEKVVSVQLLTPVYVEPASSDFPTADAWYRAMYQFLAQTVPPEVVAPLMTARNEEMSLQARSGKHPREVADALVLMWRQLQSELGSAKAFAFD